jgi:hypothetical protein
MLSVLALPRLSGLLEEFLEIRTSSAEYLTESVGAERELGCA